MKNNNVLVTGGAGFIGSNYVSYLLKSTNAQVFVLDSLTYAGDVKNLEEVSSNPNYIFIEGDICNADTLKQLFEQHQIDTVVHFAAESHVDNSISGPAAFIQTNIVGTFQLLQAAYQHWMEGPNQLKSEFSNIPHDRGVLSAARSSDPNSANSQFFICFDSAPHLDRQYSVFGQVVNGMELIDKIKKGDGPNGSVSDPDKILSISLVK